MNPFDPIQLRSVLCLSYRTMVASASLLEFAIPRSSGALRDYYEHHLDEERGHDEMLRADLLALGVSEIPVSHQAAQIAGSQYYLIAHDHPALLLGYMHALERESLALELVDELADYHDAPLTALKHHCLHDPLHRADMERVIEGLESGLRERVLWNERCVLRAIESAMRERY